MHFEIEHHVIARANGGGHLTRCAKASIQRTVAVVPCEGKSHIGPLHRITRNHDLAVSLDHDTVRRLVATPKRRGHLATGAKAGIERTIAVVPDQRHVVVAAIPARPD